MMRTLAIVGSGPAGFYTAEAALKAFGENIRIDIIDRLRTPYGLIRAGVAPDHQSIKAVTQHYDDIAADSRVRFLGGVSIGEAVSIEELRTFYDDVVLAVGAPRDRSLDIEGAQLPGVLGSAAFVGWYNGHPDFAALHPPLMAETAVVIGNGNVALDCARILAKSVKELQDSDIVNHALDPLSQSRIEAIHVVGRRGPLQASFTLKETQELGKLDRATPLVRPRDFPPEEEDTHLDSGHRRMVGVLRKYAEAGPDRSRPVVLSFDFFRRALRILGTDRVEAIELMQTRLEPDGSIVDTGVVEQIRCGLVVTAIGYRSSPIPGVPFDDASGGFVNDNFRIDDRLWAVGWARRGPTGTVGTNRADGFVLMDQLARCPADDSKAGRAGMDKLLAGRDIKPTRFRDWKQIDALEMARARAGAPREKIVSMEEIRALSN